MFSKVSVSFLVAALTAVLVSCEPEDCSNACTLAFRCSPFWKENVWAVEDGVCRVFQNGCLFAQNNCQRQNQCKSELTSTTESECAESCPSSCLADYAPVCASFPNVTAAGENVINDVTFSNTCELNIYSCQNGVAYVNEPSEGECA